jgi:hypothetical protein
MRRGGKPKPGDILPAIGGKGSKDGPERDAWQRVERVVLTLAEIIGRRMARDDFETRRADHASRIAGQARDGPDEKDG